jgi:hypothetical protein
MTPEEQLEQDRQLIWYWLGDENYRQLRGVLLDQDAATLKAWLTLSNRLSRELQRALAWHQSGAFEVEAEDNPADQGS